MSVKQYGEWMIYTQFQSQLASLLAQTNLNHKLILRICIQHWAKSSYIIQVEAHLKGYAFKNLLIP